MTPRKGIYSFGALMLALGLAAIIELLPGQPAAAPKFAVTTYHYDNLRTGWNSQERTLTPRAIASPRNPLVKFARLAVVRLDDTVYAQPLVMPDVNIASGNFMGQHDVVYTVTENNSVYAIDANNGTVLLTRNLGPAVPRTFCGNNGPRVGIESTPVIDAATKTLYLMSYQMRQGHPAYVLYGLDLATLEATKSRVVTASHRLTDGSTYDFDPEAQRQRAALLFEDGNIYAAFTSFCDSRVEPHARGWLLGWRAADLERLPASILTNQLPGGYLSSIWMSGYGVAAIAGHLYFVTGNAEPSLTYNNPNNLSESVIKVSADLTQILDFFTPSNVGPLDVNDTDLGSGGVMIVPDQPGAIPRMAVAAGKQGQMYLLNRTALGGYNGGPSSIPRMAEAAGKEGKMRLLNRTALGGISVNQDRVVGQYSIGSCYCGQSYYLNRIVSSGGSEVGVWQINTSPATGLKKIQSASLDIDGIGSKGDGFFTAVSSNGSANAIIWAVSQRENSRGAPHFPRLFAFQPVAGNSVLQPLLSETDPATQITRKSMVAGRWDWPALNGEGGHSNIVPVVANGHVYVASYTELDIFGFTTPVIEPSSH